MQKDVLESKFKFVIYSLGFVSIEKIYQTLEMDEIVFHPISKHLEFRQKYSAMPRSLEIGWNAVSRVWYITWTMY